MEAFKNILVPIDLSEHCKPAVELATQMAVCNQAKIVFCYVGLPPLPPEAMYAQDELDELLKVEGEQFEKVVPLDAAVEYEHLFLRGNPGPEIVSLANEQDFDVIVVGTHGRTGIVRWVLGSVAEYVIRNAGCPVISVKLPTHTEPAAPEDTAQASNESEEGSTVGVAEAGSNMDSVTDQESAPPSEPATQPPAAVPFVTSCMAHSIPIHDFDEMPTVIKELVAARVSAAPVVDGEGVCVGILTETDIEKYLDLWRRMDEQDESVLDEVYETDSYGLRRISNTSFHAVKRHMTSPVITVTDDATCQDAEKVFSDHPEIHHLVVVNKHNRPVGILESDRLYPPEAWNLDSQVSL